MVWQRVGTVSVQNGSTTVTGAGVDFAASSRVGDSFVGPDGATYEVANIASATVISILPAYKGATVSGAAYAIMPVQGYDKMLSDAFNALVNQFGTKLAALGTTGNYDILPVEKGGNGNTTGMAAKLAAAAMVGTVSQSGGTPTGSIIERGSNSNGEYTKLADGTMICWRTAISVAATANVTAVAAYNFPAVFSSKPSMTTTMEFPLSNDNVNITRLSSVATSGSGGYTQLKVDVTQSYMISYVSIGRWFQ